MVHSVFNIISRLVGATLIGITLAFGSLSPSVAQELSPDHLALARSYVEITDGGHIYETTLIQTGIATMRTLLSQNPTISEPVSEVIGDVIKAYAEEKDELFDQFARIYALRFTIDELKQAVAFYESDVGRKLTASGQQINAELQAVMQVYQSNLNIEFFAKVRAELREKGIEV